MLQANSAMRSASASFSPMDVVARLIVLEVPAVVELADALDSKFRNHQFYLINRGQMPIANFIGKSGVCQLMVVINEGSLATPESRTKVEQTFVGPCRRGKSVPRAFPTQAPSFAEELSEVAVNSVL